jgi:DNA repair protein RecO (recombination protein O)
MRNFKTTGIIIRRHNFKDADRILTVLTEHHGKISIRASGIRRISSRRSPHVELLNHCVLTLYNGHAFPVLTEVQTLETFSGIKEDLERIGLAYHLCELVDGLCAEGQENRQVFTLVKDTLARLEYEDNPNQLIEDFQTELLSLLGFWNKQEFLTKEIDADQFVENIIERKLKSKSIFAKLQ